MKPSVAFFTCSIATDIRRRQLCSQGSIMLNVDLVRAAPRLIGQVVGHELARGFHGITMKIGEFSLKA